MRETGVRMVCNLVLVSLIAACTDGRPEPPQVAAKPEVVAEPEVAKPESEAKPEVVKPEVVKPEVVKPEQLPSEPFDESGCPKLPETPEAPPAQDPAAPAYNGPPKLEVITADFGETNGVVCPFDVVANGFPVISDDGSTLLDASPFRGSVQEEGEKSMRLTFLDGTNVRVEQVYSPVTEPPDYDAPKGPYCKPIEAKVRERVAQLNAELDARTWRRLEPLDALYTYPGMASPMSLTAPVSPEYMEDVFRCLAGADRPIEIYWHGGHLIAKVRDIRVLQSLERSEWRQRETEFCTTDPQIEGVEFDRATKQALVRFNHFDGGCLCEFDVQIARIELSPELFAEIDRRSMAKYAALQRAFEG